MGALPGLVRRLLDEGAWQEFITPDGRVHRFERLRDFIKAPPPRGLDGREAQLVALCGSDQELVRRLTSKLREEVPAAREVGRPSDGGNVRATNIPGRSDTADHTVARLKRDDPDLADRVIRGEISADAAAREKGWRKPRIVLTSPEAVAMRIRQHFTADQVARLVALLISDDTPRQPS